jgi:hypothetical protein
MDEEIQKIISDQLKRLPEDVRAAILSVDYKTKLQEITKRQRLLIDQAGKLEMETTLVMIGLEPVADYVTNVQRELEIPPGRAQIISQDVNENIFMPIRESLHTMNESTDDEDLNPVDEPPVTKFTNSNETNLNRDQILNEIENPSIIKEGDRSMSFSQKPVIASTSIEIPPTQEIQTIPGQGVKNVTPVVNIPTPMNNILESKMTSSTIINSAATEIKPVIKLPDIEKKRPASGVDPYREPLI